MEIVFALALIVFPAQQASMPSSTGTLQGKIVRASTQEPIAGVRVMLLGGPNANPPLFTTGDNGTVRIDFGDGQIINVASIDRLLSNPPSRFDSRGIGTWIGTGTNAEGSYVFKDLAPGRYTILVQREGYFGPAANGNAVSLLSRQFNSEGGKTVTEDFVLVKGGVISGKIQNPDGQPQKENLVVAGLWGYSSGRPVFLTAKVARSDDRGEYRLFYLPPGEYIVGVSPEPPDMGEREQDTWTNVFYPGVNDVTQAVPLRLEEGQALGHIDMTLQKGATPSYKITGKILNLPAGPPANVGYPELQFMPREPDPLYTIPITPLALSTANRVEASGEFTIRNVRPGLYDLFVYMMHAPPNRNVSWLGTTLVEVKSADVEGVSLTLSPGFPLTGSIVDTDNILGGNKKNLLIGLEAAGITPPLLVRLLGTFPVDEKGSFSSPDIPAGHYAVAVGGLPPGAYVADIRYGAASAFDDGIDIGGQPQPLQIVVAANGATVQGTVVSKSRPMSSVAVVLVPQESRRQNAALYKNVVTDNNGQFTIQAVAPGSYTIFAWQSVVSGAWQNAKFLEKYQSQGKPVTAQRGGSVRLELEMIP